MRGWALNMTAGGCGRNHDDRGDDDYDGWCGGGDDDDHTEEGTEYP